MTQYGDSGQCFALENGSLLVECIQTPYGTLERVFIGSGGLYVVAGSSSSCKALYGYLREQVGTRRCVLYLRGTGRYNAILDTFDPPMTDAALENDILSVIFQVPVVFSPSAMEQMQIRLIELDAKTRGYYLDETGALFVLRHSVFHAASPLDSELIFRLCSFGGFLGLHRFAMRRWLSGIFYLLTCGAFVLGWFMDLFQLLIGTQRDGKKRLVLPLENRKRKLLLLPVTAAIAYVAFILYSHLFSLLCGIASYQVPIVSEAFLDRLLQISP